MPTDLLARLRTVKTDIENLKASIDAAKERLQDGGLAAVDLQRRPLGPAPRKRRVLQGHYGKVYALAWAGDSRRLVSASQDGKFLLWDALQKYKLQVIPLKSSWVMTCAFETTANRLVAAGGLDNVCSIYGVSVAGALGGGAGGGDASTLSLGGGGGGGGGGGVGSVTSVGRSGGASGGALVELQGHDGYLSCAKFVGDGRTVLTASGDSTCILWDVERGAATAHFTDHAGDVMSVAPHPTDGAVFVSGSVDCTAKVWDTRTGGCTQTFVGHDSDINAVAFAPCGLAFATGGDDATLKLFDLRSYARVNEFVVDGARAAATSVDFSRSGRVLFAGYDDAAAAGWDALLENAAAPAYALGGGHTARVSCLGVNRAGTAVATGSWDMEIGVWS